MSPNLIRWVLITLNLICVAYAALGFAGGTLGVAWINIAALVALVYSFRA